ncbi:MAG TPA: hypothetical protein DEQ38_00490 [Elusimicrobia bacterium]|nr:hypothetical protein [Elusimicrobiota bacterium]
MRSKTELSKALNNCRRRVGGNFNLKEKRRSTLLRVIGIAQFNREAAIRYSKALEEYQYKVRQEVPCRAMYFLFDKNHKERRTGYVLTYGNDGRKWFARKREAEAALLVMLSPK